MGIALDAAAQAKLVAYLRLIEKWNKVHNLTAVREPGQMVVLHLLDSLCRPPACRRRAAPCSTWAPARACPAFRSPSRARTSR